MSRVLTLSAERHPSCPHALATNKSKLGVVQIIWTQDITLNVILPLPQTIPLAVNVVSQVSPAVYPSNIYGLSLSFGCRTLNLILTQRYLSFLRYSRLYPPIAGALAAAVQHAPAITWPLLFAELSAAQGAVLTGRGPADAREKPYDAASASDVDGKPYGDADGKPYGDADGKPYEEALPQRYEHARAAGGVSAGGGCTDAGTRLETLLKVRGHGWKTPGKE